MIFFVCSIYAGSKALSKLVSIPHAGKMLAVGQCDSTHINYLDIAVNRYTEQHVYVV